MEAVHFGCLGKSWNFAKDFKWMAPVIIPWIKTYSTYLQKSMLNIQHIWGSIYTLLNEKIFQSFSRALLFLFLIVFMVWSSRKNGFFFMLWLGKILKTKRKFLTTFALRLFFNPFLIPLPSLFNAFFIDLEKKKLCYKCTIHSPHPSQCELNNRSAGASFFAVLTMSVDLLRWVDSKWIFVSLVLWCTIWSKNSQAPPNTTLTNGTTALNISEIFQNSSDI